MISLTILPPGDATRAVLDKLRSAIGVLVQEREEISSATLSASDAFDAAMKAIRHRAETAENRLSYFAAPGGFMDDAVTVEGDAEHRMIIPTSRGVLDTWASLWSVMPDLVEKGLRAYFQSICKDAGLSLAKRGARLHEIDRELEQLRDQEETAWCELLERNLLAECVEFESERDIERVLRVWEGMAA